MPAASEPMPVKLPHTFRPLGVRLAIYALGGMLLAVTTVMWFSFPPSIRAEFTPFQRLTLAAFGLALAVAGYALARSRLVARDSGLTVVNGYRVRRYEWNEILGVTLRRGSPWAVIDLSDGTSIPAMGIQGSDGARATGQVKQLRTLVNRLTR
ncbi:MAG: PH domain-containing protein [Nocardioidaceae bacterium]